jgi:hypothetical protein
VRCPWIVLVVCSQLPFAQAPLSRPTLTIQYTLVCQPVRHQPRFQNRVVLAEALKFNKAITDIK